jgi:general secretion pathway protein G
VRKCMNEKGMTLIEIMIVLVIIGGLMGVLVPNIVDAYNRSRVKQSGIQINNIKNALNMYAADCGSLPPEDPGLEALLTDPGNEVCGSWGPRAYLDKRQLKDAFGHKFEYANDGKTASITFLGKDGRLGGAGYAEDVVEELQN